MKIAFLGDLAVFNEGLLSSAWKNNLKEIKGILSSYDIVIANLEVPLTNINKTNICKGIHLKSDKRIIDILKYLNVKGVCLANNHICDFDISGMNDTIKLLEQNGIWYFGINNISQSMSYGNEKISFHGFCCYSTNGARYINNTGQGVNSLTRRSLENALQKDKDNKHLSVLSLHWGDEYSQLPNYKQVSLMHELSNEYNFILHGHHAHVMQGIEFYNNSLLAYNQGNFCFDECISPINPKLVIKQNELNKESFILLIETENSNVIKWNTIGIKYDYNTIKVINNVEKLDYLSKKIKFCNQNDYKEESKNMIRRQKENNLAKHDLRWFLTKLNYHSIGAKLLSYRNKKLYEKAFKK